MAIIKINNAGVCVNPILTKAQHGVSAGGNGSPPIGTPIISVFFQIGSVNIPSTTILEYSLDNGITWTVGPSYTSNDYAVPIPIPGYIIPINSLIRVKINNIDCGVRTSNTVNLVY